MKIPFGFCKDSSGNIRVDAGKVNTVKLIFDLYLQGGSLRKIADNLSGKKTPSTTGKDRWAVQVINNILSNRLYLHIVASEKFVQVQLEKQRRTNTNSDHTRKTVRYNSGNVLSGLLVGKECGKNYCRITRKDGEVAWRCTDRVENGKQAECKNLHTVTDEEIKQAICDYLEMDSFYQDVVKEELGRVEIGYDGIKFVTHLDQIVGLPMMQQLLFFGPLCYNAERKKHNGREQKSRGYLGLSDYP